MSDESNPYAAPREDVVLEPWWRRLLRMLGIVPRHERAVDFERGDPLFREGIAFYIERRDPRRLYAMSPSTDESDARLELVAAEARRLLPELLAEYPQLEPLVRDRQLWVRLTRDYSTGKSNVRRERPA